MNNPSSKPYLEKLGQVTIQELLKTIRGTGHILSWLTLWSLYET